MNNIYFMCENCGIETNGITFVNGMKFCAKCYHQIFGKDNQQTEITQLKQQLAEKDKEIKKLNWQLKDKDFTIKNLNHSLSVAPNANAGQRARIDELTKIVKEKDKEIEELKLKLDIRAMSLQNINTERMESEQNQTQLAIQELEKTKDLLLYESKNNPITYDVTDDTVGGAIDRDTVFKIINQQIKELKGE